MFLVFRVETIRGVGVPSVVKKIIKGFDEKDYALAQAELQIMQLEARVEQLEPRKRRKVRTSLNSKFAGIRAIKEAQVEAGDHEVDKEDSDSSI
ncbi:hypothetical protein G7Y89_g1343 [Cudoniella acicularis]|uniref:Uncharacterized protein n=1 Tax=Cudoniella acicularis TaxID=354080 RepID=A0A8H4W732_9HELO|nr:hypothetical protein G7Y89_g1343 [Cudoniella acicularis]